MIENLNPEDFFWRVRIFDSLSYPSVIIDLEKSVVGANRKFYDAYHLTPEDILGRKCYHSFLYKNTPCKSEDCPISRVIANKEAHTYTLKRQYKWEERVFSPISTITGRWGMCCPA